MSNGEPVGDDLPPWAAELYRTVYRVVRVIRRDGVGIETIKGATRYLVAEALEERPGADPMLTAVTSARRAIKDALRGRPERPR